MSKSDEPETLVAKNPFDDPAPPRTSAPVAPPQSMAGMMPMGMAGPGVGVPGGYGGGPWLGPQMMYHAPGSQPIVHASNAPPIHYCGHCKAEIRDEEDAVQCVPSKGCSWFFHRDCVGLSKEAFVLLNEEPFAEWVCNNCYLGKGIDLVQCS